MKSASASQTDVTLFNIQPTFSFDVLAADHAVSLTITNFLNEIDSNITTLPALPA